MRDVEDIVNEIKAVITQWLPIEITNINAEKDDGFNVEQPQVYADDFSAEIIQSTPFVFFDLPDVGDSEDNESLALTMGVYVCYDDLPESANNRKAYFRYTTAVFRTLAKIKQKPYISESSLKRAFVPTNTKAMEGSTMKTAGCFLKLNLGMSQ